MKLFGTIWQGDSDYKLREIEEEDPLVVDINSPGGSVTDGFALYDAIRAKNGDTTTRNLGLAASAASIVFLAGKKRIMRPSSFLMIHNPWMFSGGDAEQLENQAETLRKMEDVAIGIYVANSNLSAAKVRKMMDKETWLTAKEALEYGFATEIEDGEIEDVNKLLDESEVMMAFMNVPAALKTDKPKRGFLAAIRDMLLGEKPKVKTEDEPTEAPVAKETNEDEAPEVADIEPIINQETELEMTKEEIQAMLDAALAPVKAEADKLKAENEALKTQAANAQARAEMLPVTAEASASAQATEKKALKLEGIDGLVKFVQLNAKN
jgi:ATP-dependent Clp endopeptidase proteolytic subunit ClpP